MSKQRQRQPPSESPSFEDEALLQDYLTRLMNLQDERGPSLEEADLRNAAQEMGLSEDDMQRIQKAVVAHRTRGENYLEHRRWDDAVEEYEQAVALEPFDVDLAHGLARAYQARWLHAGDAEDRANAERYAKRALSLDAEHAASYTLLRELDRTPIRASTGQKIPSEADIRTSKALVFFFLLGIVVLAVMALLFLVI